MPEQQGQGQDTSLDFLWIIGFIGTAVFLGWYFGKAHIVSAIFYISVYKIAAIDFVIDAISKIMQLVGLPQIQTNLLNEWIVFIKHNASGVGVDFFTLNKLNTVIGNYTKYPLTLLMLGAAALLHFGSTANKLHRTFDVRSFRESEQDNWPQIKPILKLNLVKQKLDEGPWAIALSPMRFCKKNNLLDVEKKNDNYVATLRRGAAYRVLSLQLGPKWHGADNLPPHLKALFAVFAARTNGEKKIADKLVDQLSISSAEKELNLEGVSELIHKHVGSKKVAHILSLHGYVTTVLASMLVSARSAGVLATSEFIWLKPIDRRMWYMLNSVGRQTAVAEISGAFAHWLAEKKIGLPLMVPMVEEAVRGLDLAMTDTIYKPDEVE